MRILLCILIIAVVLIIAMIVSPTCREQVKGRFCPAVAPVPQEAALQEHKIPEAKPAEEAAPDLARPAAPEEPGDAYIVQVKDDLVSISEKRLGDSRRWIDIYNANRDIIKSPVLIFPGQKLRIPAARDDKK